MMLCAPVSGTIGAQKVFRISQAAQGQNFRGRRSNADRMILSSEPLKPIFTAHLFPALEARLIELLRSLSADDWEKQTLAPKWKVKDIGTPPGHRNARTRRGAPRVQTRKLKKADAGKTSDADRHPQRRGRPCLSAAPSRRVDRQNGGGLEGARRLRPGARSVRSSGVSGELGRRGGVA